jgi:sigma-B regulation protein RsbU (phosphoserine phosphatase)
VKQHKPRLFQIAAAAGAGLAVLLMVETVVAYRYSVTRIARDQGFLQAVENASSLEHRLRREQVNTADRLQDVLAQIADDRSDEIAWITVIDASGQVRASAGRYPGPRRATAPDAIHAALERADRFSDVQETFAGEILVALLPIKPQFQPGGPGDWRLLEIALYLRGPQGVLHPLRRNLMISTIAAIALLAAMIVFLVRLKTYVRRKTIEAQLLQARAVQRRLLPQPSEHVEIEFAGECVPAGEVGGDFYDVFPTAKGEIALVLADVSGKGLPAALRMGVVHGAIRALAISNDASVGQMAGTLNTLLREESSREFVTVFWGLYNPETHDLRYVNAGHIPPLLVATRSGEVRRLETGGPVLGLLPAAAYEEERIQLDGEQLLIAYSDGLMEATNPAGEEFGESRILPLIRPTTGKPANDVLRQIIDEGVKFIEDGQFHDDLTVFVAKLASGRGQSVPFRRG